MKNTLTKLFLLVGSFILSTGIIEATPSSLFWTNCTTAVYDTGTGHLDIDNYGTIFNRRGHGQNFAPDVGVTFGLFTWEHLKGEAGFDYQMGTDDPLFFNAKVGVVDEDILFPHAPSMSVGIFNAGTRRRGPNRTDQDVVDIIIAKTLPDFIGGGTFNVGGFAGNHCMGKNRQGFMLGYANSFVETIDCCGKKYSKFAVNIDYASGKNTIGGLGLCIYYYFTPDIYIETGPVFFNSAKINGTWKYSLQLNFDFDVLKCKQT